MKKAFALLELLVVIAIVGLIGALMLPVLGRAREAGRRAQCVNNLRQHGIAWHMYLDDHEDYFPGTTTAGSANETRCIDCSFGGKAGKMAYAFDIARNRPINRYLGITADTDPSVEVFHCPDDIHTQLGSTNNVFDGVGNSYVLNNILQGLFPGPGIKLSQITAPLDKLCMETDFPSISPGHSGRGSIHPRTPLMVLFVDGHVQGPFLYTADFEILGSGKVLERPN